MYLEANDLYGWTMSQKLPADKFKWKRYISKFNEKLIKTMMKKVKKDIYLKQMLNILKGFKTFTMICHLYQKKWKLKNATKLYAIFMIKTILFHKKELQNKH